MSITRKDDLAPAGSAGEAEIPLFSNGHRLDTGPDRFGELRGAQAIVDDLGACHERMEQDGYLLFRGFLDRDVVMEARREIMLKFATIGEIDGIGHDPIEGIGSTQTFVDQVNLVAFTESVRTGFAYRRVVENERLIGWFERFLGGPVGTYDFKWPRFVRPGEGCGIHCDAPYINRGTDQVYSAWIPLGDVSRVEGAFMLLEGSHTNDQLRANYCNRDADRDNIGWLSRDPNALQRRLGGRWLSTDFKAGDVLVFCMYLAHCTLDNKSPERRCRLTSDTRYQLVSEPFDDRWNGPDINPHGGRRVFLPGLVKSNNKDFEDEWKWVDETGRLVTT